MVHDDNVKTHEDTVTFMKQCMENATKIQQNKSFKKNTEYIYKGCVNKRDKEGQIEIDPMDHDITDYAITLWITYKYYNKDDGTAKIHGKNFVNDNTDDASEYFSEDAAGNYTNYAKKFGYGSE